VRRRSPPVIKCHPPGLDPEAYQSGSVHREWCHWCGQRSVGTRVCASKFHLHCRVKSSEQKIIRNATSFMICLIKICLIKLCELGKVADCSAFDVRTSHWQRQVRSLHWAPSDRILQSRRKTAHFSLHLMKVSTTVKSLKGSKCLD
jgi:hypothetical protein